MNMLASPLGALLLPGVIGGAVSPPAAQTILLVSTTGNSRSIGRPPAQAGDTWPANALQYTQAGALSAPTATVLDVGDTSGQTSSTMLSPFLPFANYVNAQQPGVYEKIIFVADGQSSTGFTDGASTPAPGTWAANNPGNRFATHLTRWNAAYAAVQAAYPSATIETLWHHYSAAPDVSVCNDGVLQGYLDGYRDSVRANATGVGSTGPIILGGGEAAGETGFTGELPTLNNTLLSTYGASWDYGDSYPINIDKYNLGGTFPLVTFDGTHLDRASVLVQGQLIYWAWQTAKARSNWRTAFTASVPDSASIVEAWDFNIENLPIIGDRTTNRLQWGSASYFPTVRGNVALKRYTYTNPTGTVVNRSWKIPTTLAAPTGSYTKALLLKQDALGAAMSFWGNVDNATTTARHRLQYSASASTIQAGNGSSGSPAGVYCSFPSADFTLNVWHLLVVTYDAATTTMTLYLDGVQKSQSTSVPACGTGADWGYLGNANSGGTSPTRGIEAIFAYAYGKALSAGEVATLTTYAQSIVTLG